MSFLIPLDAFINLLLHIPPEILIRFLCEREIDARILPDDFPDVHRDRHHHAIVPGLKLHAF
jgi:hypothetical protein